jgi:AraC family transcriptional regulator
MRRNNLQSIEHNGEITGSQSVAGFYFTETAYAPRIKVPMHAHRYACFCLVLEGTYVELYREKVIECKPSHLIFRPAEEVHADHIGNGNVRCFIIEVETEWLTRLHKYSIRMDEPAGFQGRSLVWLAMRLRHEAQRADDFTPLTVEGLMLEIAAEVARGSTRISERKHPQWLERAKEILHENFNERMTLTSVAEAVGVHPVYLAGVFRQHYDCSIGEYIRRLRIEYASREISRTNSPLADIALAAGFAHQAHFSRTFKRLTGLTPAQYRSTFRPS